MEDIIVTGSAEETISLATDFVSKLKTGTTLCLFGEMGVGKTTFTQGLGGALGIARMTSPTYTIVRQYPLKNDNFPFKVFYHIDLYRLKAYWEIKSFDLDEVWSDKSNLVVIEWPEKLEGYFPKDRFEIKFKNCGLTTREITFKQI